MSKAWYRPALLDELSGPDVRRLRLGKVLEGGLHVDVARKTLGAWQTANTMRVLPPCPTWGPIGRQSAWRSFSKN